jgi:hypothetical protein
VVRRCGHDIHKIYFMGIGDFAMTKSINSTMGVSIDGFEIQPSILTDAAFAVEAQRFSQIKGPQALAALLQSAAGVSNVKDVAAAERWRVFAEIQSANHKATLAARSGNTRQRLKRVHARAYAKWNGGPK